LLRASVNVLQDGFTTVSTLTVILLDCEKEKL
jgi:hypothetical protein